jgi:heme A synthase
VDFKDDPQVRRRWRREALLVVALTVLAAVLAAVAAGTEVLYAVALTIFGVACVLGTTFVFYEVGRSEDYERAGQGASRSTTQPPPSSR